ncbi:MAG: hypothetical protein A2Y73_04035, partial [Chloroflexi bacterium RBG_13_56_8]
IPLGIDPFLLYKSRDPVLSSLHDAVLEVFNAGIDALRQANRADAQYLFDFPEASEIGLGYTARGKRGSGVGALLSELIIETLLDSPPLVERGVRHIEEMQLVSVGIGADRVSDITANLTKRFLIEYTQKQCELWNISLHSGVPVSHIFDSRSFQWCDDYVDLPTSPLDGTPILLVPRRIVRTLPWINYGDYFRMEFSAYLRAKRVRRTLGTRGKMREGASLDKSYVVAMTRSQIERIDRYVDVKEATANRAHPSLSYLDGSEICLAAEKLKTRMAEILPGREDASEYQRVVLEILNYLFMPELIDGEMEVETYAGTERRDIIFTNDSDQTFWDYVRHEHSNLLLMFETKNTHELNPSHMNQTANYLGDRLGYLGFIVTRNPATLAAQKKVLTIYNDSRPRKIVLILSDQDLENMLDMKGRGKNPMRFIQRLYREFRQSAQ